MDLNPSSSSGSADQTSNSTPNINITLGSSGQTSMANIAPAAALAPQTNGAAVANGAQTCNNSSKTGIPTGLESFDFSNFDPLQMHALQFSASTNLANILANPAPQAAFNALGASADASTPQQNPFFFLQNAGKAFSGLVTAAAAPVTTPAGQQAPVQPVAQTNPAQTTASTQQPSQQQAQQQSQQQVGTAQPQKFVMAGANQLPIPVLPQFGQPVFNLGQVPVPVQAGTSAPSLIQPVVMAQPFAGAVMNPSAASVVPPNPNKREAPPGQANPSKKRQVSPSVVSSSTVSTDSGGLHNSAQTSGAPKYKQEKQPENPEPDVESMNPTERRRYERNLREQQRSYRISQQIKQLRDVLSEANIPFKANKFSILLSVAEYIKQLQTRAIMLDAEHQKLVDTIRVTNEMLSGGQTPSSSEETGYSTIQQQRQTVGTNIENESDMLFVQGLDYRSIFDLCPTALGVAALDGRLIACNAEFEVIVGRTKEQLLQQSLFNLMRNHQDVFKAISEMLKSADPSLNGDTASGKKTNPLVYWCGRVVSHTNEDLAISITLTRTDDGNPKFFNCALTSA